MTKNDKTLTFLTMIAAKIMNNYEKLQNMTKTLTFLNMITTNDKPFAVFGAFLIRNFGIGS